MFSLQRREDGSDSDIGVGEMVGRGMVRRERDEAFLERMYSYIRLHIVWDNNRSHPSEHSTHATTHTNHLFVSLDSIMKLVELYTTDRSVVNVTIK